MGFERFGKVSFVAETKAADFVKYLEEGKVMVTRCKECGAMFSPPKMDCNRCFSSNIEWIEPKQKGKLVTFTTLPSFAPTGFSDDLPYTLGLVEFEEGIRMFGRVNKAIPENELQIGLEVRPVPTKLPSMQISYEFERA